MNSVLSALQPKPHVGSNGFDLSHRDVFSTKPGILLPVFYQHVHAKSTFRVDVASIIETTTLQTNAFARGSFNLDFYFVPYRQMFMHADEIILGRGQHNRALLEPKNGTNKYTVQSMPMFPLGSCVRDLFKQWLIGKEANGHKVTGNKMFTDMFGENAAEDALRILDLLGYGNYLPIFKSVFYDYFARFLTRDMTNDEVLATEINTLNFNALMHQSVTDGSDEGHSIDDMSDVTTPLLAVELLSGCFNWHVEKVNETPESPYHLVSSFKYYNIFALAAYQKVWNDMFRNVIYDTVDYTNCFNFDWMMTTIRQGNTDVSYGFEDTSSLMKCLLMPRYRQWKKDLFTGTYPSAQFGDVAFQQVSEGSLSTEQFTAGDSYKLYVNGSGAVTGGSTDPDPLKFTFNGVGISALDIRYTMAMQRYRERLLRCGNRTKDVLEGTLGVKSRYIEDDYVDFLGTFSGTLNINKVAGTTNEGDTSIGELGAYGNSSIQGKQIERQFNDFGIVIGVLSFVPETEYNSLMVDPFNTKTEHFDYYQPDFDNLGLSPVYGYELDARLGSQVLGYTARYHEYKMAIDKVHGEFFANYRPFVHDSSGTKYGPDENKESSGVFSDYVTPRDIYFMQSNNWLARYYINPKCMNSIFLLAVGDTQDTDCFKIDMNFILPAVQPMSVTGLPQL